MPADSIPFPQPRNWKSGKPFVWAQVELGWGRFSYKLKQFKKSMEASRVSSNQEKYLFPSESSIIQELQSILEGRDSKGTFLTQQNDENKTYSLHDMIFPAGRLSKLVFPDCFSQLLKCWELFQRNSAKSLTTSSAFLPFLIFSPSSNSTKPVL